MKATEIINASQEYAQLQTPFSDDVMEGLTVYVDALNTEANLSEMGAQRMAGLMTVALANRLKVDNYLQKHPELLSTPVEKPMFVFGLPRTGTTITINLLNEDPARRCYIRWEAFNSVPPPKSGEFRSDPRYVAEQATIDKIVEQSPETAAMHHEDADSPTECQMSMAQTMCSQVYDALAHVPSYGKWLLETSYIPAFTYHKRLLQLLQSEAPGKWTLKNPWHPLFLKDLITVYPDAQLVMNHRDPVDVMGSACSLIRQVRSGYTDQVDNEIVAQTLLSTFDTMIQRTLEHKARHGEDSIYDLHYGTLMGDPIGEMKKLYAHFDEPFTAEAETAMLAFLAKNPKGKHGSHKYSLEEFGLTKAVVREHFRDYCERFDIPCKA